MYLRTLVTAALLSLGLAAPAQSTPQTTWPTQDGTYTLHNSGFTTSPWAPRIATPQATSTTPSSCFTAPAAMPTR
jgi:murein endopeptidase